jgi:hypothetical protein
MSDQIQEHKPQILSPQAITEGGYTFLKRALRTAVEDEEQTVVVDSGGLLLTYVHNPHNETFMDGIRSIEGEDPDSLEAFKGVAGQYFIKKGLAELAEESRHVIVPEM